ncbi:MAG: ABC transporter permease, partial [Pseudooceanicola sp.]
MTFGTNETTGPDVAIVETEDAVERRAREAYFTASQRQLIWARFRKNTSAMVAAGILVLLILTGIFAPFLSPHDPTIAGRDKAYTNGAPQVPKFCDDQGCSWRPFIYGVKRERSIATNFRWVTTIDTEDRRYVQFLVRGWDYSIGPFSSNIHLFGVDEGFIHLFGTDDTGKDIFSRTLHAIYTSLAVGTLGVLISFVMALIIGGVAGYFGGWIDGAIQM